MKSRVMLASLTACLALTGTGIWLAEARTAPQVSQTDNAPARRAFEVAMNLRQSAPGAAVPTSARHLIAIDQFRSGGGSADHFTYTRNERVDPQHVRLDGSYIARSTVFLPDRNGQLVRADPTNVLDFTAQLEKDAATGQWTVASFDWHFAPGSEP
jgi:hypothetical protein